MHGSICGAGDHRILTTLRGLRRCR